MLNLIVAPYDVSENAEKYAKRIVSFLKAEKIEFAAYFHTNLDEIAKSVNECLLLGENEFVVVGGDAAIGAFINAVKDLSKIKFGVVPTSSHEDFAKFLGLSANPMQAIKDILLKQVEPIDYLLCNEIKVANNILIGASVEVFEKYNERKVKNFITQKLAVMQYGGSFEGVELTMDFKGNKNVTETIYELSIANGGLSQGKKVSPLSNVNDGVFNFNYAVLPEKNERKKYLSLFKKGEQIYKEATHQFWLENLKITQAENKIKALIDGRIFSLEEVNVSVVENGLKIYRNLNNQKFVEQKEEEREKEEKPKKKKQEK